MQTKIDKKWAKTHSDILRYVFRLLKINREEFAEEILVSYPTVRQWFSGRGFPSSDNLKVLYPCLQNKVDASQDPTITPLVVNHLGEILRPTNNDFFEFNPSKHTAGQYLVAKLSSCYAKGNHQQNSDSKSIDTYVSTGAIKAVVFDFDGTLTIGSSLRTTWESIWIELGYDAKECQKLHQLFDQDKITHENWCKRTEEKFKAKNLRSDTLSNIAKNICLLDGCKETFEELRRRHIKIYIVSGSILDIIKEVVNGLSRYIDDIKANDFKFSSNGQLVEIIGTKYDFKGKATFITETANTLRISPKDILFVGNCLNDRFAYESGAKTLFINPKKVDTTNFQVCNYCIDECNNLTQILEYIDILSNNTP